MLKRIITGTNVMIVIVLIITGCGGNRKSNNRNEDINTVAPEDTIKTVALRDTFLTIDVTKKYPQKELKLQDFMDVEYIPLETTDEFVCQGAVVAIGKDILLVRNIIRDGNIYVFYRNGLGLRKFNRMGQGPGEYLLYFDVFLDETNAEIIIEESAFKKKLIYDLHGNFLRNIHKDDTRWFVARNFDDESLFCKDISYMMESKGADNQRFVLISKQDGSLVKDFRIYFKKRVEWGVTNRAGNAGGSPRLFPIVPYNDRWLLMEPSSDTIFCVLPDYSMTPFMARTPSIQSMKPAIFLLPCIFTERFYFMETVKMEYDFTRNEGFPKTHLAYDRLENTLFEYTVFNDDFLEKGPLDFTVQETSNSEIAFCQKLEAYELLEAYQKGQLKGKLKEIAAELEEESNPVIMLVKYKK